MPPAFVVETEYRNWKKVGAYGKTYDFIANRAPHKGVGPRELQRARQRANGTRTDVSQRFPEIASKLAAYLERWEREHPRAEPVRQAQSLSPEELEQLRDLDYLP